MRYMSLYLWGLLVKVAKYNPIAALNQVPNALEQQGKRKGTSFSPR